MLYEASLVLGVVSPLDLVTQELHDMKGTVNSVQASLITSVSLIQGNTGYLTSWDDINLVLSDSTIHCYEIES